MTPVESLLAKLPGAKKAGTGWSARCPAHEDRKPSLSLSEGEDGRALVKCHAGCSVEQIVEAVGLRVVDLMPKLQPGRVAPKPILRSRPRSGASVFPTASKAVAELERQHGERAALWTYHDERGQPIGAVVRWDKAEGKLIRPVAWYGEGWCIGAMPDPRPLYGLPELTKAPRIIVVEGEKAAEAARRLGFVATTSAGGSQAASKTDWRPLAGKEVWIFPDNDAAGRKYAAVVAAILAKLSPAPMVRIVELPDLPESGDMVDWIEAHSGADLNSMRKEVEALAQSAEPSIVNAEMEAFKPFPVDALPEPVRGFVAAGAKAIGCDPSFLALPLLTSLAAAIGNTRRLVLKRGWSVPPIIWCAVIGESGTAKTPAFKLVMRPVRERQQKAMKRYGEAMKQYAADHARWEKEHAAWKQSRNQGGEPPKKPERPACERFIVSDTTVEALAPILLANPRGLLLARDELAGWLGSFDRYAGKGGKTGADSPNWLSMFNAENIIVDRKTGIPPTIFVPHAAMCVCGGIQPGILQRSLGGEHRESGLMARLLLAYPPRRAKRWCEADIDPKAEEALAHLVDRLFDLQPTTNEEGESLPVLVRLTPAAKTRWIEYYNLHAREQTDLTGDLSAAWSKLEEYAARLALVIHYARWASNDVADELKLDAASMDAGISLANWFKGESRRVYAMLGESELERDERRLVEWIDRKGGTVTAREVQQGCRWLKEPGAAEEALEELAKKGRGCWKPAETTLKGGRPSRVFALSTPSTVYESPPNNVDGESFVDVDNVDEAETPPPTPSDSFPFGLNNPSDPDGGRLFPDPPSNLPD